MLLVLSGVRSSSLHGPTDSVRRKFFTRTLPGIFHKSCFSYFSFLKKEDLSCIFCIYANRKMAYVEDLPCKCILSIVFIRASKNFRPPHVTLEDRGRHNSGLRQSPAGKAVTTCILDPRNAFWGYCSVFRGPSQLVLSVTATCFGGFCSVFWRRGRNVLTDNLHCVREKGSRNPFRGSPRRVTGGVSTVV